MHIEFYTALAPTLPLLFLALSVQSSFYLQRNKEEKIPRALPIYVMCVVLVLLQIIFIEFLVLW